MRLTQQQVRALKDGQELKVVYTGSEWGSEFGKIYNVVKIGNRLYHINDYDEINEIEEYRDGYDIIAIMK